MFFHIDMDCFFVSVHRSLDMSLLDKPVAVGSKSNLEIFRSENLKTKLYKNNQGAFVTPVFFNDLTMHREYKNYFIEKKAGREVLKGIVITSSYEARRLGVKTGMRIYEALRYAPNLIVIPTNMLLYHTISYKIYEYLLSVSPDIEQFSIDEFFIMIDIDKNRSLKFARFLQKSILKKFNIPVSIGIHESKWIAKLATKSAKPYGIFFVDDLNSYIKDMPIEKFPGIGKGFYNRLKRYGIKKLGEIKDNKNILYSWKKPGIELYNKIFKVNSISKSKSRRKSIGLSRTFDAIDFEELKRRIVIMARHISFLVYKMRVDPTSYYLKINYEYGIKVKDNITVDRIFNERLCKQLFLQMFYKICKKDIFARKLTLRVYNFAKQKHKTLSLLEYDIDRKDMKLTSVINELREGFGLDIVKNASELKVEHGI